MVFTLTTLVISSIGFLIIGIVSARFFYSKKSYRDGKEEGAYEKEKELFYEQNTKSLKTKLELKELELKYRDGIKAGKIEERKKLDILITPQIFVRDNLLSKSLTSGYTKQITYDGFPIGETKFYIEEEIEKFKDENLKYVVDKLQETVLQISDKLIDRGFSVLAKATPSKPTIKK
ncbi:hypothetical protein [Polaribacter sp. R77954]|uniref:hypothetical protein n=1 Tax=Polaribacter sp. R77954 TaxID=3093870 RepID=UPI0037CAC410